MPPSRSANGLLVSVIYLLLSLGNESLPFIRFNCVLALIHIKIEPWHVISNNVVCATNKGSDQPAHTRSLIRAFACRLNIL